MPDIYISYARSESSSASELARAIQQAGFSVWWDRQIMAGDKWANQIEEQLNSAGCVIVLWSRNSVSSDWVREEALYARQLNKLIQVVIDDVALPLSFRTMQTVMLIGWSGDTDHSGFRQLLEMISSLLNPRASRIFT